MDTNEIKIGAAGFVRLVDTMGDDSSVVQAARISYGNGTKTVREDRGLIRYLLRNYHTTPFEMCEIKLHVRVPMDTWRQWIRHRTASVNEYSTRYSEAINEFGFTHGDEWRAQSSSNKQGSGKPIDRDTGYHLSSKELDLHNTSGEFYKYCLQEGVAKEQARKNLPLCTYTEAYWKIDLHNLFHFLRLRLDSHAQLEIRQYAEAIAGIVKEWVPICWEAFVDYRLEAMSMSRMEMQFIRNMIDQIPELIPDEGYEIDGMSKREVNDLLRKLKA